MVNITAIRSIVKLTVPNKSRMWRYCHCCYSAETLEKLCSPALDAYMLICSYEGLVGLDYTQLLACQRCREFLKEVHNFRIERNATDENLDVKPHQDELMSRNTFCQNYLQIEIKKEIEDEYNEIDEIDVQINKVEDDSDPESSQKISEESSENLLVPITTKSDWPHNSINLKYNLLPESLNKNYHQDEHSKEMVTKSITTNKSRSKLPKRSPGERPFSCEYCDFSCNRKDILAIHTRRHLNVTDKPYKCNECSYTAIQWAHMKTHVAFKHSDERPFSCDQCSFRAKTKTSLTVHKKTHLKGGEKPLKCSECTYATAIESNLIFHVALKHTGEKPFSCDQCDYRCNRESHLIRHKTIHSDQRIKPYTCSECSYATTTIAQLKGHIACKHSDEKPYSCDICDYQCKTKDYLSKHIRRHLKDTDKPFKCKECSYATTTNRCLREHFAVKHSNELRFSCDQCDYRCKLKSQIFNHKKTHLNDCDKPYKCNQCSYTTTTKTYLKNHVLWKHSDAKPFSCEQCNYSSKSKQLLSLHLRSHLNDSEKPFKCSECSYTTTTKGALKSHVVYKHSDEKPIPCDQCNYRCKTKAGLSVHIKNSHSILTPCKSEESSDTTTTNEFNKTFNHSDEKPFSCDQCNYRSRLEAHLAAHKKIHSKSCKKPYKCTECSYTTMNLRNLKNHLSKHSDDKPFACDQCSFRCKFRGNLINHKKIHMDQCDSDVGQSHNLQADQDSSSAII